MTSRFIALALAFIIGSPACWCCANPVLKPAAVEDEHACCHESAPVQKESAPKKEPCPCMGSLIQREMAKAFVDVPPPELTALAEAPLTEIIVAGEIFQNTTPVHFDDTGPPHVRPPAYLQQHALLM